MRCKGKATATLCKKKTGKFFHPKRCAVEKSVDNRKNIDWLLCRLGRVAYLCS